MIQQISDHTQTDFIEPQSSEGDPWTLHFKAGFQVIRYIRFDKLALGFPKGGQKLVMCKD